MAAGQFTKGPQHLFARFRSSPVGQYFGTCVKAPSPEHEFYQIPILNDLGGRSVPFQLIQDGENAVFVCVLNRFDITVARGIRALHGAAGGGTTPNNLGNETAFARGTLVLGSSDFELIVMNAYYNTPAAGLPLTEAAKLNPGRRYYSASIVKYKEDEEGARVTEVAMVLRLENLMGSGSNFGSFGLYTESDIGQLGPIT